MALTTYYIMKVDITSNYLCILIKKHDSYGIVETYLDFIPSSWHRVPKTLGIS